MVSDKEYRKTLNAYKNMTNMSSKGLKKWSQSKTYKAYSQVKSGPPASEALKRNMMLQRKIENGTISKRDYSELQKAVSYLERAKAEYRQEGAGSNKIAEGLTTKRVAALRGWAYDPYYEYT